MLRGALVMSILLAACSSAPKPCEEPSQPALEEAPPEPPAPAALREPPAAPTGIAGTCLVAEPPAPLVDTGAVPMWATPDGGAFVVVGEVPQSYRAVMNELTMVRLRGDGGSAGHSRKFRLSGAIGFIAQSRARAPFEAHQLVAVIGDHRRSVIVTAVVPDGDRELEMLLAKTLMQARWSCAADPPRPAFGVALPPGFTVGATSDRHASFVPSDRRVAFVFNEPQLIVASVPVRVPFYARFPTNADGHDAAGYAEDAVPLRVIASGISAD